MTKKRDKKTKIMTKTNTFEDTFKEQSWRLETFDQSDEETRFDTKKLTRPNKNKDKYISRTLSNTNSKDLFL